MKHQGVISSVLKNIAHKFIDCLPRNTALCSMMVESLTIAQAQLADQLTKEECDYLTRMAAGSRLPRSSLGIFSPLSNFSNTPYSLNIFNRL